VAGAEAGDRSRSGNGALLPGLGAATVIAVTATVVGHLVPVLGAAVPALVIGAAVASVRRPGTTLQPGVRFAGRTVLQLAVVLLGTQLSLADIGRIGASSLPVMLTTLAVCLVAAFLLGRLLDVRGNVQTLIGVGTGICGASAIAAVAPVVGAASAEVAYAVSTIFLFNIAAVFVFPLVGHLMGLDQHAFGLFAGTAINDTSSVVAAAAVYGSTALGFAVVVKLVRTLMIVPIVVALTVYESRRRPSPDAIASSRRLHLRRVLRLIPWFIGGFVLMSALRSVGAIPDALLAPLAEACAFLIAVAMAAIGLSTDVATFRRAGVRPLLLGGALWLLVSVTALLLIVVVD
jgi:uncharacterized integral membrane protein (TIGR00698 family)